MVSQTNVSPQPSDVYMWFKECSSCIWVNSLWTKVSDAVSSHCIRVKRSISHVLFVYAVSRLKWLRLKIKMTQSLQPAVTYWALFLVWCFNKGNSWILINTHHHFLLLLLFVWVFESQNTHSIFIFGCTVTLLILNMVTIVKNLSSCVILIKSWCLISRSITTHEIEIGNHKSGI